MVVVNSWEDSCDQLMETSGCLLLILGSACLSFRKNSWMLLNACYQFLEASRCLQLIS